VLRGDEPVRAARVLAAEAELASRRLRAVGFLELVGYLSEPEAVETVEPVSVDELEGLLAAGDIDLIDVRELDERERGLHPGSRHIPYRLLPRVRPPRSPTPPDRDDLRERRAGRNRRERAGRSGVDARPVLRGGVHDWEPAAAHGRVPAAAADKRRPQQRLALAQP